MLSHSVTGEWWWHSFPKALGPMCHFRAIKNPQTLPIGSPTRWWSHCKQPFPWPPMWRCLTWLIGCRNVSTPASPLPRSASSWDLRGGSSEVRGQPSGRPLPILSGTDLRWKCKVSRAQTKERPSQSLFLAWVLSQRPLCTCVFLYVCMHVQTHAHTHPEFCTQALKTPGPWHAAPSISFTQCWCGRGRGIGADVTKQKSLVFPWKVPALFGETECSCLSMIQKNLHLARSSGSHL